MDKDFPCYTVRDSAAKTLFKNSLRCDGLQRKKKKKKEIKLIHSFKENLILKADLSPLVSCSCQVSNNQDDCMEVLKIHFPNYDEIPADGQQCTLHKLPMMSLAFMKLRCALCVNYRSVMSR